MTEPRHAPTEVFAAGVREFNALRFWEAHEQWESLWLEAGDDLADFYQGLIQLAAAYHHVQRGTFRGGVRLFDAALARLARYPAGFHGLDRAAAERAAALHRTAAESSEKPEPSAYPKLALSGG